MISASHNPFYDNGIKVINGSGYKLEAEIEDLIEAYIDSEEDTLPFATRENIGKTVDYSIGRNRYIGYLISLATRSFEGKRVGLDLANGSATTVAKGVFDALGAKTYVINSEPDGTNINHDCGSTHIEQLQRFVVDHNLDVGFAYDGDADRCLAIDEKGNIIDGDLIMYLCGVYLKSRNELANNTIVTTIMSNLGLYKALDRKGIRYEKTAVGDKYVFENMMANGHSMGGEQSGHIIFHKHATTGDGVLTSLKLMEVMLESKATLSELHKEIVIYPQLLVNVKVYDKKAAREDRAVMEAVSQIEKELGDNGRILVRESGTEPVIRVMVEAESEQVCKEKVDRVVQTMKDCGHVIS
jgi:phosphoglucosamine mutase